MKKFPYLSLPHSLIVLRVSVALIFLSHAIVRIFLEGSVAQFAGYLNDKGLVMGLQIVWLITVFEIVGGVAMILGYLTKWFAAGFIVLLLVGIVLIHAERGWFVGEHGSGGCEYSYILMIALLVIAANDRTV